MSLDQTEKAAKADPATIEGDVLDIIARQAKVERALLTRSTSLAELNVQSLDLVEIIFALEDKFDIEVPYNANDPSSAGVSFQNVGDVIDGIAKLIGARDARKPA
ncbi:MAG TPA: phosphopantetheine-binding protein [Stellaceae bacterium]|nr:phosphopantetheine-binding protein [Stellaceae bacterium]